MRTPDAGPPTALVLFLGGSGANAERIATQSSVVATFLANQAAVAIPQGLPPFGEGAPNWAVRDGRQMPRDDVAFILDVIADARMRLDLNTLPVLLTGFSRGGSMIWDIACQVPEAADAYAPIAGAFWIPEPQTCNGPVHLFHTHGFTDPVVPLEGRPVRDGTRQQGDVFTGLRLWRAVNACGSRADDHDVGEDRWIKRWTTCEDGSVTLMLHEGGHAVPSGWADTTFAWFEASVSTE
ncbi:polyhydroxybutyrate depolymerase [Roseobacter sp. YSTF-M11]|uniref:Polyhydroxybutyrate depolymerase n=1 Tax=Roseobacter insulae TaxID=2859783 RepID=A0A9X1K4L1_9RHOB|nr:polyhydroxybutyrate depolymerase [Roseobacter insulae]MBW4709827.1 polyhydroxybutyrate depolymerase [Roseobacter insulae]